MQAGPDHRDAAHHCFVGHVDELFRLDRDAVADEEHAAGIAVPAIEDHRHIDIDDIPIHQPPIARDAVADDVVNRGADRFWEAAVVERRRDRIVIDDEAVAKPIELQRDELERREDAALTAYIL